MVHVEAVVGDFWYVWWRGDVTFWVCDGSEVFPHEYTEGIEPLFQAMEDVCLYLSEEVLVFVECWVVAKEVVL